MNTTPFPGSTLYGTWPEPYAIEDDRESGRLVLRTPFYEIEHNLKKAGAIESVRCLHASGKNLLLGPVACDVVAAEPRVSFSDVSDPAARVEVKRVGDRVLVEAEGVLLSAERQASGIEFRFVYEYHWGAIRVQRRLRFPAKGMRVSTLRLFRLLLRPELGSFGIRPGAPAEASSDPAAFGVCQWGRFVPGQSFDCPWESRFVPRYVVCADPGREGLEWFASSELSQWDYQVCGKPGYGHFHLAARSNPPAVACEISPLCLTRGSLQLAGDYVFDSWLGIPVISGRAHRPFLHVAFNRKPWPTLETVRSWADRGVRTAHFHHDGDSFRDGLFWRDGSYPPFGPEDMREYDRVIRTCQEHGLRVATYFSNKELHPTTDAYKKHGQEWARLPGDRAEQLHNHYSGDEYGAQMCLRSGWLDQLKQNIDTVLSHHPLNGVYYDWNVALYCHNPAHGAGKPPATAWESPGLGSHAFSPAGHWDVDELVDLMEWTRQRVGRDGLIIVHNTMVPSAVTENFADHIVAMEWGYSRLSLGAPPLASLPLEWDFLGARPRGVIGYGCLEPTASQSVHRQMTLRCLLTGVAPWTAGDLDLELFAPLRGLDLSQYRFFDWRRSPVRVGTGQDGVGHSAAAVVYAKEGGALVLVGNLTGQPQTALCCFDSAALGGERWRLVSDRTLPPGQEPEVTDLEPPADGQVLLKAELPADGFVLLEMEKQESRA